MHYNQLAAAAVIAAAACQRGRACVTAAALVFTVIPSPLGQMVRVFVSAGRACLHGGCVSIW